MRPRQEPVDRTCRRCGRTGREGYQVWERDFSGRPTAWQCLDKRACAARSAGRGTASRSLLVGIAAAAGLALSTLAAAQTTTEVSTSVDGSLPIPSTDTGATTEPVPTPPAPAPAERWLRVLIGRAHLRASGCRVELDLRRFGYLRGATTRDQQIVRLHYWRAVKPRVCGRVYYLNHRPIAAIAFIFGRVGQAREAVTVAGCETGRRFNVSAANGQYRGLFQMGSSERRAYGFGATALRQARAAKRMFVANGHSWSRWQCTPYGGLRW